MIGLAIPIYNRPEYVKRCFESLLAADLSQLSHIVFVNDASSDMQISDIIGSFPNDSNMWKVKSIYHYENKGVRECLKTGIDHLFREGCIKVINLDSDAIVKPDFIKRLTDLHGGPQIVSGFNCESAANPWIAQANHSGYKAFANGINMCFNKAQYEKYIKPALAKVGNWDYNTSLACQADNLPFIVTIPSVVQHIGVQSSMGHVGGDFAADFKMLSLPDVTLFGVDAHDPAGLIRAAEISQRDVEYGAVNIITERLFSGREAYSKFILKDLAKYIETSHVLIIHPDGYVLNWQAWDNDWLQYDYIGATWWYKDNMNVGNGGFSLRSKRLQEIMASQEIPAEYIHPEDHCICRIYRESLERDFGIKFAPEEVANKFSIEAYNTPANQWNGSFGFHGPHVTGLPADIAYKRKDEPRMQVQTTNRPDPVQQRRNMSRHNPRRV